MPGLDYDNSAASFFGLTILGLYLAPATYYIQRRIRQFNAAQKAPKPSDSARSEAERQQLKTWEAQNVDVLWTPRFKLFVGITAAAGLCFLALAVIALRSPAVLAKYDPYAILGISVSSSEREIKSAYRKLSLLHHPDKGGDVDKFQAISKAYEALTDPVSAENYRLYGNPDGKQPMEISIGLPTWLQSGFTGYLFLLAYMAVLVVLIPTIMCNMYRRSAGIHKSTGFKQETMVWLVLRLERTPATVNLRTLPEMVAGCPEFRALADESVRIGGADPLVVKSTENTYMEQTKGAISAQIGWRGLTPLDPKQTGISWLYDPAAAQRNALLLLKYALRRNPSIRERIKVETDPAAVFAMFYSQMAMLDKSTKILDTMVQMCVELEGQSERNALITRMQGAKSPLPVFRYAGTIRDIARFSGYLIQGLWEKDNDIAQAVITSPRTIVEEILSSRNKGRKPSTLRALLDIPPSERPIVNDETYPAPYRAELGRVLSALPDVWIFPHLSVADVDDDVIREGDIITATFTLVHANVLPAQTRERLDAFRRGEVDLVAHQPEDSGAGANSGSGSAATGGAAAVDGDSAGTGTGRTMSAAQASVAYGTGAHKDHAATLRSILTPAVASLPVPHVYAPLFIAPRGEETWHVLFASDRPTLPDGVTVLPLHPGTSSKSKIIHHKRLTARTAVETVTVWFQAPATAGTHPFSFQALSTDYVGLDASVDIQLHVAPKVKVTATGTGSGAAQGGEGEEEDDDDLPQAPQESMESFVSRMFGGAAPKHGEDDDSDLEEEEEGEGPEGADGEGAVEDGEGAGAAGEAAASGEAGGASAPAKKPSAKAAAPAAAALEDEDDDFGGNILAGAGGGGKKGKGGKDKKEGAKKR